MLFTIALTYLLLAAACTVRIVSARLSPAAAWAWILAVWLLPAVGMVVYVLGAWHNPGVGGHCRRACPRQRLVESVIAAGCGSAATADNTLRLLNDGGEKFPSLIRELQRARHSIHLEYYIFDGDRIGSAIADILCRKVRAGVSVRLLYDAVGSWRLPPALLRRLRDAGVEVCAFGRVRFPWLTPSLNIRNHRKIAVIDGRTAFLGGINIARRYLEGDGLGRWRDEHLQICGGAAASLQRLFADDWVAAGGQPFDIAGHVAPCRSPAAIRVQIGWSQSGRTRQTLADAFMAAIMQARHEIMITTPYFVPPQPLLRALCTAASGGVQVRLMVPLRADMRAAALAGESYFGELLGAGAEIYLYDSGFLHSKTMVVDSHTAVVGTANMDYRSLCTNREVAAFVYDARFCRTLADIFRRDVAHCRRLTLREYGSRPLRRRITADFCRLFSPLL